MCHMVEQDVGESIYRQRTIGQKIIKVVRCYTQHQECRIGWCENRMLAITGQCLHYSRIGR